MRPVSVAQVFWGHPPLLQQGHQQRYLGTHQAADQQLVLAAKTPRRPIDKGEHHVQRRRGQTADDAQQRLDGDEGDRRVRQQRPDQQGAGAQRGDVARNDQ